MAPTERRKVITVIKAFFFTVNKREVKRLCTPSCRRGETTIMSDNARAHLDEYAYFMLSVGISRALECA